MAENVDEMGSRGKTNIFGRKVEVQQMQSEAGAAGALHGALAAGSLATTFTSSQGLLLMIPNMYKIAGENLPCVIHVAARTVATHALSIFGDHSDVMAVRQTGFGLINSRNVQECQDMALAAHLITLESKVPFVHFFDGFRTSHEINKIEAINAETVADLVNSNLVLEHKNLGLTPLHPTQRGTAQNEDVFFQAREASNPFYANLPKVIKSVFNKIKHATGREYKPFEYFGAPDAELVLVSMGSSSVTINETIKYLNSRGVKIGAIFVRVYRPFDAVSFSEVLPQSARLITVLDRTKEAGAVGEPLYTDVIAALAETGRSVRVIGGRYGLSSKEFTPSMVYAIYENMLKTKPKNHFTIGITDDISNTSLNVTKHIDIIDKDTISCKFYGLGSDGTVSANKSTIKIIGEQTPLYAQGYFVYDSKKSGSITTSHLRLGKSEINAPYLIDSPDFVACHNPSFIKRIDVLAGIKTGGILLLNASWTDAELERELPAEFRKTIANKRLKFYIINAESIAEKVGLNRRINLIMQTCFFKLAKVLNEDKAISLIKEMAKKSYASKGEKVLDANMRAIDKTLENLREVKFNEREWANAQNKITPAETKEHNCANCNDRCHEFYHSIIEPIKELKGNLIPVSALSANGEVITGTTCLEKRNIATALPEWLPENCI